MTDARHTADLNAGTATAAGDRGKPPTRRKDDEFVARVQAEEITVHDRGQALYAARWVCRQVADGRTVADIVKAEEPNNPEMTHVAVVDFVSMAIGVFCPEFAAGQS